jgi:hypothetical protein
MPRPSDAARRVAEILAAAKALATEYYRLTGTIVRDAGTMRGIDHVLYTEIGANITSLTATQLARLAIRSVGQAKRGMDGISYLIDALARGLTTPLSAPYEAEIKRMLGVTSLKDAVHPCRRAPRRT